MSKQNDVLIVFEEVVPLSELSERERQLYKRGLRDGLDRVNPLYYFIFIAIALVFFAIGGMVCKYYPALFK